MKNSVNQTKSPRTALPVIQPSKACATQRARGWNFAFQHQRGNKWAWPKWPQTLGSSSGTKVQGPWHRRGIGALRCGESIQWSHEHKIFQVGRKTGIQAQEAFRSSSDMTRHCSVHSQETIKHCQGKSQVTHKVRNIRRTAGPERQGSVEWCISSPENKC